MAREDIIPSGFKGAAFEQKGMEERNLQVLLKSLSNKETQKAIENLSKIEKDEWKAMAATAVMLNSFVSLGGTSELATILTTSIGDTITLQIESILTPITNEINQAITNALTPFITDILTPVINDLNAFLSENKAGAGIGGIIGGVAGLFIPGGPIIGAIVGAILGALIESGYGVIGDIIEQAPENLPFKPDVAALYEQQTGNKFVGIMNWDYINWYNNIYIPNLGPNTYILGQNDYRGGR